MRKKCFLTLFLIFLIGCIFLGDVSCNINYENTDSIEEAEENTVYFACLFIAKYYVNISKKETEASFQDLKISQDKFYIKLFLLTFTHCKKNMKFEQTQDVIEAWLDNGEIDLSRYSELINPEIKYDDIYKVFELTTEDKATISEMEEVEKIFKKNEENKKKIRAEVLKQLEERINNERYKFRWIFGQDIWIVIYISVFSLLISGCFFFLFTGFSISGKLEALDKEEETVVESTDANFNNGNNKKGAEKK